MGCRVESRGEEVYSQPGRSGVASSDDPREEDLPKEFLEAMAEKLVSPQKRNVMNVPLEGNEKIAEKEDQKEERGGRPNCRTLGSRGDGTVHRTGQLPVQLPEVLLESNVRIIYYLFFYFYTFARF